jgi:predicted Holliday junction resolvase-like endonuclease
MEITSYVLGMLTIVATLISMSIVVGLAKINKLARETESLKRLLEKELENVYNNTSRENEAIWRQFETCGKDVTMVERTIMQRIDKEIDHTHRSYHEIEQNIHREIDDTRRYIDSRIDKVILKGTEQGSKQILKG